MRQATLLLFVLATFLLSCSGLGESKDETESELKEFLKETDGMFDKSKDFQEIHDPEEKNEEVNDEIEEKDEKTANDLSPEEKEQLAKMDSKIDTEVKNHFVDETDAAEHIEVDLP